VLFRIAADTEKTVDGKPGVRAIKRETLRSFYDGTLFPQLAAKNARPTT
jgi:hypothetical protein